MRVVRSAPDCQEGESSKSKQGAKHLQAAPNPLQPGLHHPWRCLCESDIKESSCSQSLQHSSHLASFDTLTDEDADGGGRRKAEHSLSSCQVVVKELKLLSYSIKKTL